MMTSELRKAVERVKALYDPSWDDSAKLFHDEEFTFGDLRLIIEAVELGEARIAEFLDRAAKDAKELGSGKDFNQGVVRGLEIAAAQVRSGYAGSANQVVEDGDNG